MLRDLECSLRFEDADKGRGCDNQFDQEMLKSHSLQYMVTVYFLLAQSCGIISPHDYSTETSTRMHHKRTSRVQQCAPNHFGISLLVKCMATTTAYQLYLHVLVC